MEKKKRWSTGLGGKSNEEGERDGAAPGSPVGGNPERRPEKEKDGQARRGQEEWAPH